MGTVQVQIIFYILIAINIVALIISGRNYFYQWVVEEPEEDDSILGKSLRKAEAEIKQAIKTLQTGKKEVAEAVVLTSERAAQSLLRITIDAGGEPLYGEIWQVKRETGRIDQFIVQRSDDTGVYVTPLKGNELPIDHGDIIERAGTTDTSSLQYWVEHVAGNLQKLRSLHEGNGRHILIDCDGVLTDGRTTIGSDGQQFRHMSSRDNRAIRELVAKGWTVVLVTASSWPYFKEYAEKTGCIFEQIRTKEELIEKYTPYVAVGDDTWDIELLKNAEQAFCPQDSDVSIIRLKNVTVLPAKGGDHVITHLLKRL